MQEETYLGCDVPTLLQENTFDSVHYRAGSEGWRVCVAPMIDVTDRHCRYFHRLLAPHVRLYTEMITTGAIEFGDRARLLDFNTQEHPVALQLGGSEPAALAASALAGQQWGYDEINLNCGCPSERVQKGAFGACLMAEAGLVADCIKAMQDAVSVPVTVKHRLGLDYDDSYDMVRDFVGALYTVGCRVFIVHARNAVLKGLSPKDNREIPPLRYNVAEQLRADFPEAVFVLNGGISQADQAMSLLKQFDGVMLGRAAWHDPAVLTQLSRLVWPATPVSTETQVIQGMVDYAAGQVQQGVPLRAVVRPMLGWLAGRRGARRWRQMLSDPALLKGQDPLLIVRAYEHVAGHGNS